MRYPRLLLPFALFATPIGTIPAARAQMASAMDHAAAARTAKPAEHALAPGRFEPWTPSALEPVPEPAIWSMMIAGIGFAGAALRRSGRRHRA